VSYGKIVGYFHEEMPKKRISLKLIMQRGVSANLLSDELKLRQILINFTGNALKFTDYGRITTSAESYLDAGD